MVSAMLLGLALALPIHETIVAPMPTEDQVRAWSSRPGTRAYLFQAAEPFADELERLAHLRYWDRLRIETARYPDDSSLRAWESLARQGAELVALGAGYPTDAEVARLEKLRFAKTLLVLPFHPGPEDAARIGRIPNAAVTFATGAYPKYLEKPGFEALPASLPLLFATDYWPAYSHLDFFNLIPQPISLRVSGSMPPPEALPYLQAIRRLDSIAIETYFDPPAADWANLDFAKVVSWTSLGHVPAAEALRAFAAHPAGRSLRVDLDGELAADERARLEACGVPVEWVHAPND
jgi:hypothetical protein